MKRKLIFLLIFWFISISNKAQNKDSIQSSKLVFELTLFDFPYQLDAAKTVNRGNVSVGSFLSGYANPSMHQSLNLSADLYTGVHYGINQLFKVKPETKGRNWTFGKRFLFSMTMIGSDFITLFAPGFDGWEHEEYHRAVLTRFHVNSFNDMNKFPLGAELINVSHVADEDLIRFKLESPSDFIRSHVAGIEGEYLLIDKLQRNNFFYNQNLPHELFYLLSTFNSIAYIQTCSSSEEADKITDTANLKENNIAIRDFTGLDFLSWTYDLFRPNKSYTERGIHPSGIGVNRYIKTTDLTSEELSYLKKQGNLHWINALSPMLIGFKSIKLTRNGLYGNFSVHHYLTSFGNDISLNIFLKDRSYNIAFSYHSYQNYHNSFPAIEAQLIDLEKPILSHLISISPRLLVGLQPSNQEFKTANSAFLGLVECKVELKSKSFIHPFMEFSAKSNGWVAGNEYLNSNISCRLGIISNLSTK